MKEKIKTIIGFIVIILIIMFMINVSKNRDENSEGYIISNEVVNYNNETGEYYLVDETTGEVTHTARSEDELYIYKIDPDYNPKSSEEEIIENFSDTDI